MYFADVRAEPALAALRERQLGDLPATGASQAA
jgi:hypothetical protein